MTAVALLAHAHHAAKHKAHSCGLAVWCHEPPKVAKQDAMIGHYAAAFVVIVLVFAALIVVLRWKGKRKSAKPGTRRPAAYPPSYGGR